MKPFDFLQIDTCNVCNLRCEYCYMQNLETERGSLPLEDLEWILSQVGRRPLNQVRPFHNGDPLCEVRLPQILRMIKERTGARTCIYTNGTTTRNRDFLLSPDMDDVKFTISAATPETYARVHGRNLFDAAQRNLAWFKENKRADQTLEVHFVTTDHNAQEIGLWGEAFADYERYVSPLVWNESNTMAAKVNAASKRMFTDEELQERFMSGSMPCVLYNNLTVDWKGRYLQCCTSYSGARWNYGTIHDRTPDEAWQLRQANRLNNPICNSCNLRRSNFLELLS